MRPQNYLEALSNELWEGILHYLDEISDLRTLSLVSRGIYHRVIRRLYGSWKYYGLQHTSKSLRLFLQTILWRPDLAAHVQTLDIREWMHTPRLKQNSNEWYVEPEEIQELRWRELPGESESDYEDEQDGDYVCSESESEGSDDDYDEYYDSDWKDEDERDLSQLHEGASESLYELIQKLWKTGVSRAEIGVLWDQLLFYSDTLSAEELSILEAASLDLGDDENLLSAYHSSIHERSEFVLIAHLLCRLPNLRTLSIVLPEDGRCGDADFAIQRMLNESAHKPNTRILKNLETLYICGALRMDPLSVYSKMSRSMETNMRLDIGPKGHLQFRLELESILPFLKINSLRSVFTLNAHTYDDPYNFPPLDFNPYFQESNITTLAFDEAMLTPSDAVKCLRIPKALEYFRWAQQISCFSLGSCYAPFHSSIGRALQRHKNTLKHIDLDIRHRYCSEQGHRGNPFGNPESLRSLYGDRIPDCAIRGSQDAVLIGSFIEYNALQSLSIDATALCGHQNWAPAPYMMVHSLPPTLQELTLRIFVNRHEGIFVSEMDNTLWTAQFKDMVRNAESKLPQLRRITISVIGRKVFERRWMEESCWPILEDERLYAELREVCEQAGIELDVKNGRKHAGTEEPFFQEQIDSRKGLPVQI